MKLILSIIIVLLFVTVTAIIVTAKTEPVLTIQGSTLPISEPTGKTQPTTDRRRQDATRERAMKCDICGADPMTANCNQANCDKGVLTQMFEEMGVDVIDVTPKEVK